MMVDVAPSVPFYSLVVVQLSMQATSQENRKMTLKTSYLFLYNTLQAVGWGVCLCTLLSGLSSNSVGISRAGYPGEPARRTR
eukprot:1013671-Pelagomonas_calceolata.AAC.1